MNNMNPCRLRIILIWMLPFVALSLFAQEIKQSDDVMRIKKENRPAVSITAETLVKPLQKEWAAFLKKNHCCPIKI